MIEGIDYELYNYMKLTISMKELWKMLSLYERYERLRGKKEMGGHVESRVNQQGPPCKAKYSWVTDSEVVP